MQQPQDNEFTRAEEIRKLRVIPELISHHLEIRGDDPAVVNSMPKPNNGKRSLLKSSTLAP